MDKILYKLDTFEGPLDLLLTLIQKNKVSIYDIPIVEITAQYLEAIDGIEEANLDNTSEFLVMASNLLYIKSKMLLPKNGKKRTRKIREKNLRVGWLNISSLKRRQRSLGRVSLQQKKWCFVSLKKLNFLCPNTI